MGRSRRATPKQTVEQYFQIAIADVKPRLSVEQGHIEVCLGNHRVSIPLLWTSCNYGSGRPWFRCPRCSKRVGKLYWEPLLKMPACRQCYQLTYRSTRINEAKRLSQRSVQLRRKLGASLDQISPISDVPAKPKGMHWRTYWRIVDSIVDLEERAIFSIENNTAKILKLINRIIR